MWSKQNKSALTEHNYIVLSQCPDISKTSWSAEHSYWNKPDSGLPATNTCTILDFLLWNDPLSSKNNNYWVCKAVDDTSPKQRHPIPRLWGNSCHYVYESGKSHFVLLWNGQSLLASKNESRSLGNLAMQFEFRDLISVNDPRMFADNSDNTYTHRTK